MENNLFQIGKVVKTLGITRRILINYESFGLITPRFKNDRQRIRYYSADDIVQIKLIRSLQQLGLSIAEIHSYFENTIHLDSDIERLEQLRNQLDQYIAQLKLRQVIGENAEIHQVTLSGFTAYCREFHNADLVRKTAELRQTVIDAMKHNTLDTMNKICIQSCINNKMDGTCIIPVQSGSTGENIQLFPQTQAICVYYRGPYECFPTVYDRLLQYAQNNQMTPCGYFRNIFMEGPPTRGADKESYITQIALPIKLINADD